MPSPADTRTAVERLSRWTGLLLLAASGYCIGRDTAPARTVTLGPAGEHLPQLIEATRSAPAAITGVLAEAPNATTRAWLRALRAAGTPLNVTATGLPTLTIAAEPMAGPQREFSLTALGEGGMSISIDDGGGRVDSVAMPTNGAVSLRGSFHERLIVASPKSRAIVPVPNDVSRLRSVLVLGRAGWEAKFVVAALEEAGWLVESRFVVAPARGSESAVAVNSSGRTDELAIDTHMAVVALDESAAVRGAQITAFVRSGGGLVLGAAAAQSPSLRAVAPARPGNRLRATLGAWASERPHEGLSGQQLDVLAADAVVLEQRGEHATMVARRVEMGRVLLVGYDDTWRWRMGGAEGSLAAHRSWWSDAVSSVAHVGAAPINAPLTPFDPAPHIDLQRTLTGSRLVTAPTPRHIPWGIWLGMAALALLVGEIASRRLRGAA